METVGILADRLKTALLEVDTAGGVAAIANPEGCNIIITRCILDVTTKTTAACTLDIGVAADATTLSDTLIDGQDVNAAIGIFGNIDDQGTNGQSVVKMSSTQYVTVSVASGASAGIVGSIYVQYFIA